MPVSRATAENLAREVASLYAEAERLLIARIARNLAKGLESPHWAEAKLAEIQLLQRQLDRLVADLGNRAASQVTLDLVKAYNRGGASAAADVAALLKISLADAAVPQLGIPAVELLVAETMGKLVATHQRILRATMDAYRSVIAETAAQVLLGTQTRRQAAQAALDRFAAKGITGFIDKAGRAWNLATYTEMAMRAGTMNAAIAGHLDTMQENGLDLVIVSATGSSCELCGPHEGQVYSSSGSSDKYGSLDDAIAGGLMHPNCRHTVSAYQPGITRDYPTKTAEDREAEAQRYADSQKMRYLERQIRAAKRVEAAALDDAAANAARAKVRAYQAKARAHVADTSAIRKPHRERLGAL